MQLPSPPTDNLYKFLCIASLVAGVTLFIWMDKQITDLRQRRAQLQLEIALARAEVEVLREEVSDASELTKIIKREEVDEDLINTATEVARDLGERLRTHRIKAAEVDAKTRELERLVVQLAEEWTRLKWQMGIFALIFLHNLIMWQVKLQVHQDRLIKAQADAAVEALKGDWTAEDKKKGAADSHPDLAKKTR